MAALIDLLGRGGVYPDVPGRTPRELIQNLIAKLELPASLAGPEGKARLLKAVLEREDLVSTAEGKGIALPHPRNPLIQDPAEQFIAVAYCRKGIDWHALDGEPVWTAILIVSASARLHLATLSRIHYLCQEEAFRAALQNQAPLEELLQAIIDIEKDWK